MICKQKNPSEKLGTGAYMAELERTRVGEFAIQEAITL
ncbi:hypothetical protein HQ571_06290 [Candidatus Kuenenbacteria bacterium]|nr:hypothetical protein [Candidatus Kuenenbacteria bacterium]